MWVLHLQNGQRVIWMGDKKHIRVVLKNGNVIKIPKRDVAEVVLPSVVIRNHYYRMRLQLENIDREIRKYLKRARVL